MSQSAKVESIDALKVFRVALIKFADAANAAVGDAESEVQRVQMWLENEQTSHWASQIRKRAEVVSRAKEALRMKKVFKDPTGGRQSAIDEEKALLKATRLLEEAEQKMAAVKSWSRKFPKEAEGFKGAVQRLSTFVLSDIPVAAAKMDRMISALEAYVALVAPDMGSFTIPGSSSNESGPAPATAPTEAAPTDTDATEAAVAEPASAEAVPTDVSPIDTTQTGTESAREAVAAESSGTGVK